MSTSNSLDSTTVVLVVLGALLLLPLLVMGLGVGGMMGYGGMMGGYWMADGWWPVVGMLVAPVTLLVLLLGGGYLLLRTATGSDAEQSSAIEELRRAYARGDLTDEEFERRRERLTRSDSE